VVTEQVKKAEETAKGKTKELEKMLARPEAIQRASQLAVIAFLEKRYWQIAPLPFEMSWATGKTFGGKTLTTQEMQSEMNIDISGFASFLVGEYTRMEKEIKALKYRNPLQDENLPFFWNKFLMDLRLLIKADTARVAAGNQGAIVQEKMSSGIVLPNGVHKSYKN
jgi:hypothetical protein